jgi:hypothetical protein
MFGQSVFAVIITVQGAVQGPLLVCFDSIGLSQLLLLFLQLVIGGFYSQFRKSRRRILQLGVDAARMVEGEVVDGQRDTNLESGLLTNVPQSVVESNPLVSSPSFLVERW